MTSVVWISKNFWVPRDKTPDTVLYYESLQNRTLQCSAMNTNEAPSSPCLGYFYMRTIIVSFRASWASPATPDRLFAESTPDNTQDKTRVSRTISPKLHSYVAENIQRNRRCRENLLDNIPVEMFPWPHRFHVCPFCVVEETKIKNIPRGGIRCVTSKCEAWR